MDEAKPLPRGLYSRNQGKKTVYYTKIDGATKTLGFDRIEAELELAALKARRYVEAHLKSTPDERYLTVVYQYTTPERKAQLLGASDVLASEFGHSIENASSARQSALDEAMTPLMVCIDQLRGLRHE